MAWSWSHSAEAYADARTNVEAKPREWLEVVFAEWHAAEVKGGYSADFSQGKYERALAAAKRLPNDTLAEFIWEKMEELATCTNGGHEAHCCPYGCMGHMVPFDLKEEDESDEA